MVGGRKIDILGIWNSLTTIQAGISYGVYSIWRFWNGIFSICTSVLLKKLIVQQNLWIFFLIFWMLHLFNSYIAWYIFFTKYSKIFHILSPYTIIKLAYLHFYSPFFTITMIFGDDLLSQDNLWSYSHSFVLKLVILTRNQAVKSRNLGCSTLIDSMVFNPMRHPCSGCLVHAWTAIWVLWKFFINMNER